MPQPLQSLPRGRAARSINCARMTAPAANYPLLDSIKLPADLRRLPPAKLPVLAEELRQFLIQSVSTRGGHFAAGLGTVELTVALHYIFNTPYDRLVWDVGHQAYPHKVLTGRREQLHTIKQDGRPRALPGAQRERVRHLRRGPLQHLDQRGARHGRCGRQARRGSARGGDHRRRRAHRRHGIRSAQSRRLAPADLLIILNDNDMSISENVGALSNYLARALSGRMYAHLREGGKKVLRQMPTVWELARRSEEHLKGMVLPGTLFEEMGFNYIGPIDGHDIKALVTTLGNVQKAARAAIPARGHPQGQGLRAGGGRSDQVAWSRSVRSGQRQDFQGSELGTDLLADLRAVAVRHGGARSQDRRHHAGDARGLGSGRVLEAIPGPLFRRGDRRTACGDLRGRPRRPRASSPWSRSTRPSCSAPTIS